MSARVALPDDSVPQKSKVSISTLTGSALPPAKAICVAQSMHHVQRAHMRWCGAHVRLVLT